jgi:hypothetical protein
MNDDPYTIFCKPPANMGEVHRIWNEMHLGDTAYAWYILDSIATWLGKSGYIYEINGEDFVAWILPNGSRFVSRGPAFIRWFLCGLEVYNPAVAPRIQPPAHVSPPLRGDEMVDEDVQAMVDQLML